jgi:hypothetical protein
VSERNVAEGERGSDRLPGESDVSDKGYPEEAPPGADPGGGERSQESPAHEDAEDAPDTGDDKATGNPHVDR